MHLIMVCRMLIPHIWNLLLRPYCNMFLCTLVLNLYLSSFVLFLTNIFKKYQRKSLANLATVNISAFVTGVEEVDQQFLWEVLSISIIYSSLAFCAARLRRLRLYCILENYDIWICKVYLILAQSLLSF